MTDSFTQHLRPVDALIIAFSTILSIIVLWNVGVIGEWTWLLSANILSSIGIVIVARSAEHEINRTARAIHNWYPVVAIFLVFKEMHVIIQSLAHNDWDILLINIDRALFGIDPTVWCGNHASPLLTEILQISYVSYYFIMLAVGVELFVKKERLHFSYALFVIVYGFFLSYLGYLAFPAVGPRFTLHDFQSLNAELPGLWLTNGIRDFINAGESIPKYIVNAVAHAQRDAFPSGHTQMTLISVYLGFHYKLKTRWVLTICGTLLVISTVYLRYHYAIDVVGGVVFMVITVWTAPKIFAWWEKRRR